MMTEQLAYLMKQLEQKKLDLHETLECILGRVAEQIADKPVPEIQDEADEVPRADRRRIRAPDPGTMCRSREGHS